MNKKISYAYQYLSRTERKTKENGVQSYSKSNTIKEFIFYKDIGV